MDNIAGKKSSLTIVTHLAVLALVVIWLIPTVGLLVSSFRDREQISETGWWAAMFPVEQAVRIRPEADGATMDGDYGVLTGNLFSGGSGEVAGFGLIGRDPGAAEPGQTYAWYEVQVTDENGEPDDERIEISYPSDGEPEFPTETEDGLPITPDTAVLQRSLTVAENGDFTYRDEGEISRAPSIYIVTEQPPDFGLQNYRQILTSDGMDRAFINTLTVTVPATVIPILIAAFAAYALAWMEFPGRGWLVAAVVGLLVVPLQLALVPMLKLHQTIGIGQSFLGIWFAHTGFGLPLAVYLLRNYMIGLPRDIIESAKVDGATDFQVFTKIVLPLSFPALASFAIFQFLWTWNDLLVAKVFLPANADSWVMTVKIADDLLGSRGGDWGILAAAAFVSIAVPLLVFFAMQKYLVRGLLAGSVK
ncbi:MAG: carbohydrate ABC transporter permease [Rhodobacteraceae bacterium]|jgi:alpha-glucoside transport system permease protein|uniref:Maltose ABC transporter membrane protein n=1 Tax=Salipiger profundus TaxID=1229727 RepID=A0A1U7D9I8_9RHOB|nr:MULTISPECIES: carbohydrate ABC transporter permease [Salipiger]APX24799.1 maltose ABC transporter membrane protein [Salipiger profundus]MAB07717.1 carbohydrate ABC transporter permease [Paracoccaceae bacterium]GFZ97897.1 alpha-glucoside ABC transporter permease [Salipiger profundus]SFC98873.1 maltose ABC transporter membrane protein /trehalose ABC transporter membrane protein /sucrose ABC transporter membrane protein [Salipiger profundus]